jgi:hypothetical protein
MTVPMASARAPSPRTGAPSLSSCRSKSSSRRNQARDPNPSRDDSTATHPSPFEFIPQQSINESSAMAQSMPRPRTAEVQGSMSIACQADPSCRDQRDHVLHGRNVSTVMPSRRSSPIEGRRQSNKGKARQMSPHTSQPAKPAEQLGKNSKRGTMPEPITAQASAWAIGQAIRVQRLLQRFEAGAFSREHGDGSSTLASNADIVLKVLMDEFSANDPEDGRYTPQQRTQDTESSPATTGEFDRMLNAVVHEVRQPRADEETSLAYVRCRAAQERLSQSVPTLCERVKTEPVAPPPVDSAYARGQRWREEFHNCVMLQRLRLGDLQANSHTTMPDQNIIFDQNGLPRDIDNVRLRRDPTHEPSDQGSPPLEYRDEPDGGDGGGSDPSSHGDDRSQLSRCSS